MKSLTLSIFAVSIFFLPGLSAKATTPLEMIQPGTPVFLGDGCPADSARAAFSPDGLSFTLLFDKFVVNEKPEQFGAIVRKRCTTILPMIIPKNYKISVEQMDYRGFVELPERSWGALDAHLAFLSQFKGTGFYYPTGHFSNISHLFSGPISQDYQVTAKGSQTRNFPFGFSHDRFCGGNIQLKISTQIRIFSRNRRDPASISVDSIDGKNKVVVKLNRERCG